MPALPQANKTNLEGNDLSAYNVCLDFEKNATSQEEVMHARVLGYLVLHAPSLNARHEVVKVIHSCRHEYNTLSQLGQSFIKYFIRPFKKYKGRTPATSNHPSRPSFDKDKMDAMATIKEAPKNHTDAKKRALVRDGFKCVVTGKYDMDSAESLGISEEELNRVHAVNTECAHIVPDSTYFNVSATGAGSAEKAWFSATPDELILTQRDYSSTVLAVLKRFGYAIDNLNGEKVHSLYNVMTMEKNVHDWFDRLEIWFEATAVKNCYLVKSTRTYLEVPERVTFTSTYPDTLAVPSPELLALHAACAKVAHLSGAGRYIDKFDRDTEDLDVLATDGTSAAVLRYVLDDLVTRFVGVGA